MRSFLWSLMMSAMASVALLAQTANHVVISEVYGGGGNSGSTWKNDFVELYNPTSAPVTMNNWSIQYASSGGLFGANKTVISGTIQPKSYFLVQELQGAGGTKDLPTPDASGVIAMSSSSGKIALVSDTMTIAAASGPSVIDFIGYGTATMSESSPAPTLSNTTSAERKASSSSTDITLGPGGSEEKAGNGRDTDNNANDFVAQTAITPQNSASPKEPPPSNLAGIGTALFAQQLVKADSVMEIRLTLRGSSVGTISALRFPRNSLFTWTRATVSVTAPTGSSPAVDTTGNSVSITGFSLASGDSLLVKITGLAAPDTTAKITFAVETGPTIDVTSLITPLPTFTLFGNPRPIANVRANDARGIAVNLQKPVTVRGIVTVSSEFGGPAYVQDASGGLAIFDIGFEGSVSIGDEVTVTGMVTQFNGLTELTNVTIHKVYGSGNEVVPLVVTASQIARDGAGGLEVYEGMLVQLNRVTVRNAQGVPISTWAVNQSGGNFWLHDNTDSVQVRIDADVTSLANKTAPTGEFDVVGVVGQFTSSTPALGGYQLMPRSAADVFSKGPVITQAPLEQNITSTSFEVRWETARPGTSFARYGRTKTYELGTVGSSAPITNHQLTISGLAPATAYHLQAFSVSGTDTSFAGDRVIGTSSLGSTGVMNVYFNKSTDVSVARSGLAQGNADLANLLLRRINAATKSIDCAVYSLSGQVGQLLAAALVQAKSRGVKVRFIVEKDNMSAGTGTVVNQIIIPGGVPWIQDDFDAANAGVGLQHNKFFVFDYRGGNADQVWVWTGSWNPTESGTYEDAQNAIEIQDQALAGAYTIEFNEMWGSETDTPNPAYARFGARKLDNTPHIFNINGVTIESYFSPSDRTTSHIVGTLDKAQNSISAALLTLTRPDIAAELRSKKSGGVKVRCILDNNTDTGSQFAYLASNGIDIRLKPASIPGFLHHKYAVVDAELSTAAQYVITGSHNWSNAAETSNNENTLIVQSNALANQYLQEFVARYKEAKGTDSIKVSVEKTGDLVPRELTLRQNYPNPFNPVTTIQFSVPVSQAVRLVVCDMLGRVIATLVDADFGPGEYLVRWDASQFASGVYYCALHAGRSVAVRPMILAK